MKKFISIIITLSIILSCVSVFADDVILDYDKYQDDLFRFDVGEFVTGQGDNASDSGMNTIDILALFGIWDDTSIKGTSLVTKTEFSVIMSNAKLGANNALKAVYEKENNVNQDKVTYKDVYGYLIEMMGYSYQLKTYGNDEKALLIVASELGLLSGDVVNLNGFVTRNELATLLMKALSADMCTVEYNDSGFKYVVSPGKTILNSVHGIYDLSGFVNAVEGLSVYGGLYLRDGEFEIDRKVIKSGEFDVNKYFGTRVIAYALYNSDMNEYNLIYIAPDTNTESIEIDFRDIISLDSTSIKYVGENAEEQYVSVSGLINVVENGKTLNSITQICDYSENEGKIVITASNNYGSYDTAIIYKYDYFVVKYVDLLESRVGLEFGMKYNNNTFIPIDEQKINRISLDGEIIPYSKIPLNSVIRVMECAHKGYLEIVCSIDKVVGTIDGLYDNAVQAGGRNLNISKNMLKRIAENGELRSPKLGANVSLYLFDNIVAGYTENSKYNYAYLKDAKLSRTQIEPEMTLRLFTQNSEWVEFSLKDKITLDGVEGVTKDAARDFIINNSDTVVGQLVRYAVNKEDQIIFLDTIVETTVERDTIDDLVFADGHENGVHKWKCDWTRIDIKGSVYKFEAGIPVFAIPEDDSKEDKYKVVTLNTFTEKEEYDIVLYSPDEFFHLPVILFRGDMSVTVDEGTYSHLYIEKISQCIIDEEGNLGYKLTGTQFVDGRVRGVGSCVPASFYVTQEQYREANFTIGDLIRIYVTKDRIDKYMFEEGFARGSGELTAAKGVYMLDYNTISGVNNYLYVGTIKKIDLERMLVLIDCGEGEVHVKVPRAKGFIDTAKKKVTNITLGDFHEDELVAMFNIGDTIHTRFMVKYPNN